MRRSRPKNLDKNVPRDNTTSRIEWLHSKEEIMSLMCSLQVCKAQAGMCGHEKAMLGIAVLLVAGAGAYLFLG